MAEEIKKEEQSNENHDKHSLKMVIVLIAVFVIIGGICLAGGLAFRLSGKTKRNIKIAQTKNLSGERMGQGLRGNGFHRGLNGQITAINGSNITVKSGGKDYAVVTNDNTSVKLGNGDIGKLSDLQNNNAVVINGTANSNGQIVATLISIQ